MAKRKSLIDALNAEEEAFYQTGQGTTPVPEVRAADEPDATVKQRAVMLPPSPSRVYRDWLL